MRFAQSLELVRTKTYFPWAWTEIGDLSPIQNSHHIRFHVLGKTCAFRVFTSFCANPKSDAVFRHATTVFEIWTLIYSKNGISYFIFPLKAKLLEINLCFNSSSNAQKWILRVALSMQKWPVSSKMPIIRSSLHSVTIFLAQQGIYRKRYLFIPNVHEEIIKSGSCNSNHYSFLSNAKRATNPAVKDSPARKMKRSTWSIFWHRICFSLPLPSCYYVKEVYEGPFSPSWKKGGL